MSLERVNGNNLRRHRVKSGLSRAQLGAKSDVAGNTIWRIETGRVQVARIRSLAALAAALNVQIADLVLVDGEDA